MDFGDRDSQSSNDNEADFELKPSTSFQFFKNQEIPIFNYDMMENKFPNG